MKVIATKREIIEEELDLEYPFYLKVKNEYIETYSFAKVFPTYSIVVSNDFFQGIKKTNKKYTEDDILNNLSTEEEFDDFFEATLQDLVILKAGL
jgi:hypothetical protein